MNRKLIQALCAVAALASSGALAQEAPTSAPASAPVWESPLVKPLPLPVLTEVPASAPVPSQAQEGAPLPATTPSADALTLAPGKSSQAAALLSVGIPLAGLGLCTATFRQQDELDLRGTPLAKAALWSSCVAVPVVGAASGHLYAREGGRALAGVLARASAIPAGGLVLGGLSYAFFSAANDGSGIFAGNQEGSFGFGFRGGLVLGGVAALLLSTTDMIDAPRAARRYNEAHSLADPHPSKRKKPTQPFPWSIYPNKHKRAPKSAPPVP